MNEGVAEVAAIGGEGDDGGSSMTLEEARAWLRARLRKGASCPCCHQTAKVYQRRINGSMAFVLAIIDAYFEAHPGPGWLHVPSFVNSVVKNPGVSAAIRGDWPKFVHWGMLEKNRTDREDGSPRNGKYRTLPLAGRYLRGEVEVPKYILTYDDRLLGVSEATVSVKDALGVGFDYREIMSGNFDLPEHLQKKAI